MAFVVFFFGTMGAVGNFTAGGPLRVSMGLVGLIFMVLILMELLSPGPPPLLQLAWGRLRRAGNWLTRDPFCWAPVAGEPNFYRVEVRGARGLWSLLRGQYQRPPLNIPGGGATDRGTDDGGRGECTIWTGEGGGAGGAGASGGAGGLGGVHIAVAGGAPDAVHDRLHVEVRAEGGGGGGPGTSVFDDPEAEQRAAAELRELIGTKASADLEAQGFFIEGDWVYTQPGLFPGLAHHEKGRWVALCVAPVALLPPSDRVATIYQWAHHDPEGLRRAARVIQVDFRLDEN